MWARFLAARAPGSVACGFLRAGTVALRCVHVLSVMQLRARAGWAAGSLLRDRGERASELKFLIRGRDSKVTTASAMSFPGTARG